MKGGKIAVTGADGFLGKTVVAKLRAAGYKVIELTKQNCDITDVAQVKAALAGVKTVIHMAAQLDEESKDLYEVNVTGTQNILDACESNGVQKLVFASSVGIFGSAKGMKSEESAPEPETEYEKSKLEAERRVLSYQEVFEVCIVRLALVLGANKYWKEIVRVVEKGFPLIGGGKNKWQLISDEDAASAIITCLESDNSSGEIFIAAEKDALTLEETVNLIRKELGKDGETKKIPLFLGNVIAAINSVTHFNKIIKPAYVKRLQAERHYSTKKIESIGWKPKYATKDYMKVVVQKILKEKKT